MFEITNGRDWVQLRDRERRWYYVDGRLVAFQWLATGKVYFAMPSFSVRASRYVEDWILGLRAPHAMGDIDGAPQEAFDQVQKTLYLTGRGTIMPPESEDPTDPRD